MIAVFGAVSVMFHEYHGISNLQQFHCLFNSPENIDGMGLMLNKWCLSVETD